ncbi:hypothetical protein NBZ79_14065 [Sneathiella marina]|uniref:Peptidase M48 domain-containing protein n=1 Tax=Sneathiella marina TaxID=2950108 RepID=A0ABY4W2F5_9PROT|nr:hypothetical protein [Sneathiella marina]USG60293.1 hypothetical protein NBZ79_14065 [Sneathiella marina]
MYETAFYLLLFALPLGVILHIFVARLTLGRQIYLSAFLTLNFALIVLLFILNIVSHDNFPQILIVAALFMESFIVVYCLVLIGVVNDSPTLAIVKALMKSEPDGLSEPQLEAFINTHPFVSSRLEALDATGDVILDNGLAALTARSKFFTTVISIYRQIIRVDRETG